jgi:hypothetical protein
MQRTLFRAAIFAAVGAVTVVLVGDTQAGHRRRGGCGSSGGYYNGYSYRGYGYSGGKYGYTQGGMYGGAYRSGYRGVAPGVQYRDTYETPETGVIGGAGVDSRLNVPTSPSDRIVPGTEGTIRGGNTIVPRQATPLPAPTVPAAPAPGVPTPAAPDVRIP